MDRLLTSGTLFSGGRATAPLDGELVLDAVPPRPERPKKSDGVTLRDGDLYWNLSEGLIDRKLTHEIKNAKGDDVIVPAHKRVTEAIRDGDSAQAHRRMATHVHGFGEALMESLGIAQRRDDLQLSAPR